jgi:hypothetical protein
VILESALESVLVLAQAWFGWRTTVAIFSVTIQIQKNEEKYLLGEQVHGDGGEQVK